MTAIAQLTTVRPWIDPQHATEPDRVAAIVASVCGSCDGRDRGCLHEDAGDWPCPPILVVEDEGNGSIVLDGHHRAAAARELSIPEIPAYEITVADYCRILDEQWGGIAPPRLDMLDEHILIDGSPYDGR